MEIESIHQIPDTDRHRKAHDCNEGNRTAAQKEAMNHMSNQQHQHSPGNKSCQVTKQPARIWLPNCSLVHSQHAQYRQHDQHVGQRTRVQRKHLAIFGGPTHDVPECDTIIDRGQQDQPIQGDEQPRPPSRRVRSIQKRSSLKPHLPRGMPVLYWHPLDRCQSCGSRIIPDCTTPTVW